MVVYTVGDLFKHQNCCIAHALPQPEALPLSALPQVLVGVRPPAAGLRLSPAQSFHS